MSADESNNLKKLLAQVDDEFVRAQPAEESDEDAVDAILEWILKRERVRYRVTEDPVAAKEVDQLTLKKMREWDSNDHDMFMTEKILNRLATSRGLEALPLIRYLQDKAAAKSMEMRRRAKAPRVQHPVDDLIELILQKDPQLPTKLVIRELEANEGGDVILKINDSKEIEPRDSTFRNIKVSGLKNRISNIRKKVSR
jgi:hypothetical protein